MAKQIRATFFFKDTNGYGWSESLDNTLQDLTAVRDRAATLAPLRVQMLGTTANLVYIRVSDQLIRRDSRIIRLSYADGHNNDSSVAGCASATLALLIRFEASELSRRLIYVKGFPDNCESDSGAYTPTVKFRAALENWLTEIVGNNWAIRSKDPGLNPAHLITGLTQDLVTGNVTVTTGDAHGFAIDKPITISGVRGAIQMNGVWNLAAVSTPTTFRVHMTQIIDPYTSGGVARLLGYSNNPITGQAVLRVSHRIAGRPFDSPRGRRRGKKRE